MSRSAAPRRLRSCGQGRGLRGRLQLAPLAASRPALLPAAGCAYAAIGASVALVCATFILPITAGSLVRRRLAAGLERSCEVLRRTLDLASGAVDPVTGLLSAASGETAERIGLDSGLHPHLAPTYAVVEAAGQALQEAYRHLGYAPLHWDAYRRQHVLPARPWSLEVTLGRGLLNSVMMCRECGPSCGQGRRVRQLPCGCSVPAALPTLPCPALHPHVHVHRSFHPPSCSVPRSDRPPAVHAHRAPPRPAARLCRRPRPLLLRRGGRIRAECARQVRALCCPFLCALPRLLSCTLPASCTALTPPKLPSPPSHTPMPGCSEVLAQLKGVEASFAALVSAAHLGAGHAALTQDVLALDALLSLLFTAATRVRRMVLLLPEALGRDQPGARALVLAHFSADDVAAWSFDALASLPLQRADSAGSIELLRASLLAAQPRRSLSSAAMDALAPPDVQKPAAPAPAGGGRGGTAQRSLDWLQRHAGVGPRHLALALQLVVAFDFGAGGWLAGWLESLLGLGPAARAAASPRQPTACRRPRPASSRRRSAAAAGHPGGYGGV